MVNNKDNWSSWQTYSVVSPSSNCCEGWKYNHPLPSALNSSDSLLWTLWGRSPPHSMAPSGSQSAFSVCNLLTCRMMGQSVRDISYDWPPAQEWQIWHVEMTHGWSWLTDKAKNTKAKHTEPAILKSTEEVCDYLELTEEALRFYSFKWNNKNNGSASESNITANIIKENIFWFG